MTIATQKTPMLKQQLLQVLDTDDAKSRYTVYEIWIQQPIFELNDATVTSTI